MTDDRPSDRTCRADGDGRRERTDRTETDGGASERVTYARLRIELPPGLWVRELSRSYPDARFRLLAGIERDGRATELGETVTADPAGVETAMQNHDRIASFERLERTDDRLLGRYETTDTELYAFLEEADLPPEFPVEVRNGWYDLQFTGDPKTFRKLTGTLSASPLSYDLLAKVSSSETDGVVTDRQREVLRAALRDGYLEVPRECTLAELATELGADKSTVSGILRRGQARLVEWFLTGGHGPGR